MLIKYYIIRIISNNLEYIKDVDAHLFEFDTEEEVREALQEQKTRNIKGLLCWKKEIIEE